MATSYRILVTSFFEAALADVKSAIKVHIDTFGEDVLNVDPPVLEAFVAETGVEA